MVLIKAKEQIPIQLLEKIEDVEWGVEKLESIGIFKNLTKDELELLYDFGEVIALKPNAHAVIEGEPSRGLFIILHGNLSVYKNDLTSGGMHRIAYMEVGRSFGELSLFDLAPRSATVVADTHCFLFYLDAHNFDKFLSDKGPDTAMRFYQKCAEDMAVRFRAINSDYISAQQLLWKYALRKAEEEANEPSSIAS